MNKTVNINLGGMFFHIDEDAYLKLTRYFDAIKRSLSKSSGQDEIIKDIEMRVAELLTENQKTDKQVVGLKSRPSDCRYGPTGRLHYRRG
jgi:hypothetical protein